MIHYSCKKCKYSTNFKQNYNRHLKSKKHMTNAVNICHWCNRSYDTRSGLWKHKQFCEKMNEKCPNNTTVINNVVNNYTNNYTNTNNNQITANVSIKFFLNNKCQDAINLTDFVDNIEIGTDEMLDFKDKTFAQGISDILIKNLNDLSTVIRPIHCTDVKRGNFYVKDNDKWEKDDGGKIDKAVNVVKMKNVEKLCEWELQNPNWETDAVKSTQQLNLLNNIVGPIDDEEKKSQNTIVKNIAKNVLLKKKDLQ